MGRTKKRRSSCPVACALDLVGDRWTLLVVRDLLGGPTHFDTFLQSPEGIATNILSARLRALCEAGFVRQAPDPGDRRRKTYELTKEGEKLRPLVRAVADWGLKHLPETRAFR